jgi:hypothetical protein
MVLIYETRRCIIPDLLNDGFHSVIVRLKHSGIDFHAYAT